MAIEDATDRTCDICFRQISEANKPSEHDPAYHVAKTYHQPVGTLPDLSCVSCGQPWPCFTYSAYRTKPTND